MVESKHSVPARTSPVGVGHFVTLVTPRAQEKGGKLKYSIGLALRKESPDTEKYVKGLYIDIQKATREVFGKTIKRKYLNMFPVVDGDGVNKEGEPLREEMHGHWLIRATSNFKPNACDASGNDLITADQLYSGATYRISTTIYCWKHETGGKGITLTLDAVLKIADGERIGGGVKARAAFSKYITDEDGDEE